MNNFEQVSVAITRRGTLNGIVVEFTGVDGTRKAQGNLKDSANNHIGNFDFSPNNKQVNLNRENIGEIDSASIWALIEQVDSFVLTASGPEQEAQAKKASK